MKKLQVAFMVLFSLIISSCSKDDSASSVKDIVDNTVSNGTWKITYFYDSDTDETGHFTGYNFTFGDNNELTATNGTNTFTGSWNLMNSNSNDDSLDDLDFIISFASPDNFEDLSEDWEILTRTSTKIELQHVSGGDGGTDLVTFEKN
jgi:hypothetical protein